MGNAPIVAMNIFERLQSGEAVPFNDPFYGEIYQAASRTTKLLTEFNATANIERMRDLWGAISYCPWWFSSENDKNNWLIIWHCCL